MTCSYLLLLELELLMARARHGLLGSSDSPVASSSAYSVQISNATRWRSAFVLENHIVHHVKGSLLPGFQAGLQGCL